MTTIDRGFSQISSPPRSPPTFTPSYIQLHLMRPSGITSWTQLLHCQYNYKLQTRNYKDTSNAQKSWASERESNCVSLPRAGINCTESHFVAVVVERVVRSRPHCVAHAEVAVHQPHQTRNCVSCTTLLVDSEWLLMQEQMNSGELDPFSMNMGDKPLLPRADLKDVQSRPQRCGQGPSLRSRARHAPASPSSTRTPGPTRANTQFNSHGSILRRTS